MTGYNKETYHLSSAWRLVTGYNKETYPLSSSLAAGDRVEALKIDLKSSEAFESYPCGTAIQAVW
ncbi:hypothetical protein CLOSTASPAR_04070 [[Clostridium] asparagiforme DSM 15981]|uniref:Uncharacterized protein n=1 Tax=[Clostridium] asparagiforme DSM 15981 TaxID=518636 RepID=C0D476_9FIRM|nr:hypothetical protein CLOSTASPAR_04070 [[Clostridium] asparagiforme DSM 15981]